VADRRTTAGRPARHQIGIDADVLANLKVVAGFDGTTVPKTLRNLLAPLAEKEAARRIAAAQPKKS
jgi:Arc/MetJ family transcription regulator